MSAGLLATIYFVVWWLCLLIVLPFGVHQVHPDDLAEGGDPGAPAKPRLLLKALITTVMAAIIVAAADWVYIMGWITLRSP